MSGASSVRGVLAIPDFLRLMVAQLLSEMGDWAARLALSVLVWQGTGQASITALVVSISFLPALGPGQWLTSQSNRLPARTVLVLTDLARAALFLLLAQFPSTPLAMAVSFLTGLLAVPFNAQRAGILPEITGHERLVAGVKVSQILQDSAVIVGYLSGGALIALFHVRGALLFNALTFTVSAMVLAALACPAARRATPAEDRVNLRGGLQALRDRPLVWAAAGLSVVAFAAGFSIESVVVPLSATYSPEPWLPTALFVGMAVVSLVATMAIPSTLDGPALLWASWLLVVVPGSVMLVAFVVAEGSGDSPWGAVLGVVGAGLLFAAPVPANALAAGLLPTVSRAAAFSLVAGVIAAGQALGTAVTGRLFDLMSFAGLAVVAVVTLCLALLIGAWARSAARAEAELP